ncbi:CRISPR-associated endonuclease Cas2 [Fundicoccus culcitae]|uniref:CRISPR-associated endoribonuclease Cas2 n=1 Tax=Fundicoccus culcitae TaxID=2969821 RepID=A0ABY5P4V4_9LACT|nr:CRISPR-associated endonuclease Cas2 [Fundicoccus culcitae]UUX33724.1 CRISPR-associated endonuclease Cas2 [Fundicoccus culcitae]
MILLICFDLPRNTKVERREASYFRHHLIELGFSMKQYSIYERYVANTHSIENILNALSTSIPDSGKIVMYPLSDEVHENQQIILGPNTVYKVVKAPQIIYI